jgi:hypothetical protein
MTRACPIPWARTVLAIHLLGVNRVSQRAKRSLSKLALFLNGTCGSARRFPASASTNRTPPRGAAHDDAYGVWNADSSAFNPRRPSHSQFWDQYARAHARQWGVTRPVGRPTGRRHADGARAFNNSRAHFYQRPRCVFVASASSPVGAGGAAPIVTT